MEPLISVIITGYKRPQHLKQTVESLLSTTDYPRNRLELILCDDGSPKEMQEIMRELPFDIFLLAERNEGLGMNINKGILQSKGDYILQLQDDWVCQGPKDFLRVSVDIFSEYPDIGMIRHRRPLKQFPAEHRVSSANVTVVIFKNGLRNRKKDLAGDFPYSDNPHIKRRAFHKDIGLYKKKVPMTIMELDLCRRIDAQNVHKIAWIKEHDVFFHIGDDCSFNPTHKRYRMKKYLLEQQLTKYPMSLYLWLKSLLYN